LPLLAQPATINVEAATAAKSGDFRSAWRRMVVLRVMGFLPVRGFVARLRDTRPRWEQIEQERTIWRKDHQITVW
jgi:hypothetical protein